MRDSSKQHGRHAAADGFLNDVSVAALPMFIPVYHVAHWAKRRHRSQQGSGGERSGRNGKGGGGRLWWFFCRWCSTAELGMVAVRELETHSWNYGPHDVLGEEIAGVPREV